MGVQPDPTCGPAADGVSRGSVISTDEPFPPYILEYEDFKTDFGLDLIAKEPEGPGNYMYNAVLPYRTVASYREEGTGTLRHSHDWWLGKASYYRSTSPHLGLGLFLHAGVLSSPHTLNLSASRISSAAQERRRSHLAPLPPQEFVAVGSKSDLLSGPILP